MSRIVVGNLRFSLFDQGEGDVILFLHGFPLNKSMWSAQLEEFATTHRVIAPDLRGHGESSVTSGTVTMREMAEDVNAILDVLDIVSPITLCGLSMGGYVAWEFWRTYAQRLSGLILCDTKATGDSPEVARARRMMADKVIAEGPSVAAESMMAKLFAKSSYAQQPSIVEDARKMILSSAAEAIAATQRGMAERTDMTSQLQDVSTRSLVLCGMEDKISPIDEMARFAKSMPHATFIEIAEAGHLAPMEQPIATNAAIRDFLANG